MTRTFPGVTLHLGDCLEVLPTIEAGSVDAVVTDPPYNVVNRSGGDLRSPGYLDKGVADSAPVDIPALAAEFARITSGSIYVWCGTEQVSRWRAEFVALGLTTRACVWIKSNPSPVNGEKLWLSGLELCVFARKPKAYFDRFCKVPAWSGPSHRVPGFPTPKPVWLMREIIEASVPPGGTVLDPFIGSGTTALAAINTGRTCVGIERDSGYFDIACRRVTEALDKTALFTPTT